MTWRWTIERGHFVLRPDPIPEGLLDAGFIGRGSGEPERLLPERVARAEQVHGAVVTAVTGPGASRGADGLVSGERGLGLVIRTADCLPILLAGPRGRAAVVHAGWRGLDAGIVEEACRRFGVGAGVTAIIGPAIGPCCFEVGEDVAARFPRFTLRDRRSRPRVDLVGEAAARLRGAGVSSGMLRAIRLCTRCHQHLVPSHRGSGGGAGRLLAFAVPAGVPRTDHDA